MKNCNCKSKENNGYYCRHGNWIRSKKMRATGGNKNSSTAALTHRDRFILEKLDQGVGVTDIVLGLKYEGFATITRQQVHKIIKKLQPYGC